MHPTGRAWSSPAARIVVLFVLALTALPAAATGSHSSPVEWSQPQVIGTSAGDSVALAASETDSQGRVYAVWLRGSTVMLSTWQDGDWAVPQAVSPAGVSASDPTVAVDESGHVLVAWAGDDGDVHATVIGSGSVTNLSKSASVVSDLPRAGFVPSLGFVVLWREMVVPGSRGCHFDSEDDRSTLDEAHFRVGGWTTPAVVYTPASYESDGRTYPTWICGLGPTAVHGASLYLPLDRFDTYQVRSAMPTVIWDGSAWVVPTGTGGSASAVVAGIGFPAGKPVGVYRSCVVGGCVVDTSTGVTLSEPRTFGPLATATAGDTMLASWSEDAEPLATLSDDGLTWTPLDQISADKAGPAAATGAAGDAFFVAYLVGGELRSVHRGTPPAGTFSLAAVPASRTVVPGATGSYALSVDAAGGFADEVALSVEGLPSAATATFSPNPSRAASTLEVAVGASTPPGSYPLTISGTSKGTTHTVRATLLVQSPTTTTGGGGGAGAPPDLTVAITASPQPAKVGDQFTYAVTITNLSSVGSVRSRLTVNLPAGVTLDGAKVNRGPGCTRTGQVVSCDLDFFPGSYTDTVLLYATVAQPGELTVTARVDSTPTDANPANDTATLTTVLQQTEGTTTTTTSATTKAKSSPKPRITILSAVPSATDRVLVRVRIMGWPIYRTARAATPSRGGCWLIWVDGSRNVYSRSPSAALTTTLPPGVHHIVAELLKDNQHLLAPRARSDSLTIRIR